MAQKSQAALQADITSDLVDNTEGAVSVADVRTLTSSIVESVDVRTVNEEATIALGPTNRLAIDTPDEVAVEFHNGSTWEGGALKVKNLTVTGVLSDASASSAVIVKNLADLDAYLVGGTYELPAGRYLFDTSLNFGSADIALVSVDGVYIFTSTAINTLTYNGTTPFIHTPATGVVLNAKNLFITTPTATAIQMVSGNSLILSLVVFVDCKKVADLQDSSFLSVFDGIPMVACADGITCHNVGVTTLNRPQWNLGQNLSGVAIRFTGASSIRGVIASVEAICDTTEAFIMVEGTYGGEMTINGGVITSGDFWATGSRDQQDLSLTSFHVINSPDSRFIGSASVQDNTTPIVITSVDAFEDLNLNSLAVAGENIERWSLTDTNTAALTCNVNGFAGTLNATLSTTGTGGDSEYHFRATKNGVQINGVIANELGNTMSVTSLSVPVTAEKDDVIMLQVANHDNTSNITVRYMDININ